MNPEHEIGVILESGLRDWQILQQDEKGFGRACLSGRWTTGEAHRKARVFLRLVSENDGSALTPRHDWAPVRTSKDGRWTHELAGIPAGGPYRLETSLVLDGNPAVEWGRRGDMVHHAGVGDVWLIAGQSNSEGHGKTQAEDPPETGVHVFRPSGRWDLASHPLNDSTGTLYPASRLDSNPSHSPWLSFAKRLRAKLGHPVGLIPAALGGSPLSAWNRKEDGCLLDNALRMLGDSGGGVRGMVWYQGESDTSPEACRTYAKRFRAFISDLRASVRRRDLPVITCQLNRHESDEAQHGGWETIREIQRRLAEEMRGVYILPTLDLNLSDGIHIDSGGNLVIGQRAADIALAEIHGRGGYGRYPDCRLAQRVGGRGIELRFSNVRGRMLDVAAMLNPIPFAVRDHRGQIPIVACRPSGRDALRLDLEREPLGRTTVTGAPSARPPHIVPFDMPDGRPMLAFTRMVKLSQKACLSRMPAT